ncbi:MAG: hypothetical protein V7K84_25010 [Nostoc sp.]
MNSSSATTVQTVFDFDENWEIRPRVVAEIYKVQHPEQCRECLREHLHRCGYGQSPHPVLGMTLNRTTTKKPPNRLSSLEIDFYG